MACRQFVHMSDWTLVLTNTPCPQLGSYLVEFSMEFIRTLMLQVSLFGGQSVHGPRKMQSEYDKIVW